MAPGWKTSMTFLKIGFRGCEVMGVWSNRIAIPKAMKTTQAFNQLHKQTNRLLTLNSA